VIARQGSGARETFTVRKQSFGVGVERMFPLHSPKIDQLEVVARGDVRRAKLYYLRGRVGKRARVAERAWSGEVEEAVMPDEEAAGAPGVAPGEVEFEEPPEEAEPVEYQAPEKEQIDEGAAVVPADAEGAQEATEAEQREAVAAAEVQAEAGGDDESVESDDKGAAETDGAESAEETDGEAANGSEDSDSS